LGYGAASGFVAALAGPELTSDRPPGALKSPKSRLQEYTQRLSGERPQYRLLDAVGPDHDKVFRVEAVVGGLVIGAGEGHSRRLAETEAAADAIESLRQQVREQAADAAQAPELARFDGGDEARADREPWVEFDLSELGMGAALAVEEATRAIRKAVQESPAPARSRKRR